MKKDERTAVVIGSDHAGWELKEAVKAYLQGKDFAVSDVSEPTLNPADDYPKVCLQGRESRRRRERLTGALSFAEPESAPRLRQTGYEGCVPRSA